MGITLSQEVLRERVYIIIFSGNSADTITQRVYCTVTHYVWKKKS